MNLPTCERSSETTYQFTGFIQDYLNGVTEQWLLVAPRANPGMLEMFRDRDHRPWGNLTMSASEYAGKYLTSAVQVLRVTGDPRLKAYLEDFVPRLINCQAHDGYLGPWPKQLRLTNYTSEGQGAWDTWGHYHTMLGLLLWHEQTGDSKALECTARMADLICQKYLGKKTNRLVDTPFAEVNLAPIHSLCILYRKTEETRYLEMALQIADEFSARDQEGPLAIDYVQLALAGKEFFEMTGQRGRFAGSSRWESLHSIMGLAELYWITDNETYRKAFEDIWWSIAKLDRHNNGGFSSAEEAKGNPYHPGAIETCCTIAWMALGVEMLKMTGNSVVADELELSTLNSVIGMHSATGRWATYDTPMDGVRMAGPQNRAGLAELKCCSVNSPRGFGIISDWALMQDKESLILNWYGPSVMTTNVKPGLSVQLTQETEYPASGRIQIRVAPSQTDEFGLKLRIPYWSRRTEIQVNGQIVQGVEAGRYTLVKRKWKNGDVIQMDLDMSLNFWVGERECRGKTSIYRGPILLTFDHRYNQESTLRGKKEIHDGQTWASHDAPLTIPILDANHLNGRLVDWEDWKAPVLLLEFKAANGETVRLCDFGSAGETGVPYVSWLPISNAPKVTAFTPENPLRSTRP